MPIYVAKRTFLALLPFLVGVVLVSLLSCHKSDNAATPVAKGARHLGVHITAAENQDYPSAFSQARSAGVDCIPYTFQWTALEANGSYDPQGLMSDIDGFYGTQPVSLSLCVSPIAANKRDLPADLMQTAFDDPVMIQRFDKLLDTLHGRMPAASIRYLLIGNEVDLYFSQHPKEWPAYTAFCQAARTHARALWGDQLLVGAETTLGAAIAADHQAIDNLHAGMDMVCLTYYPLDNNFRMEAVSQADADFETLLGHYPGRPVLMQEVGYGTSSVCSGSDSAQAAFVHEVFNLWDRHADQLVYIAFLWLNDLNDAQSQAVTASYGLTGTSVELTFTAYIRSLGLCDVQGAPKPGFQALQQESSVRGWKP